MILVLKALQAEHDARGRALHESVDGGQEPIEEPSEEAVDDENEQEAGQDSSKEVMAGAVGVEGSPMEMEDEEAAEVSVDRMLSEPTVEKKIADGAEA